MRVDYFTDKARVNRKAYSGEVVSESDTVLVVKGLGGNRTIDKSLIITRTDKPEEPAALSRKELDDQRREDVKAEQAAIVAAETQPEAPAGGSGETPAPENADGAMPDLSQTEADPTVNAESNPEPGVEGAVEDAAPVSGADTSVEGGEGLAAESVPADPAPADPVEVTDPPTVPGPGEPSNQG